MARLLVNGTATCQRHGCPTRPRQVTCPRQGRSSKSRPLVNGHSSIATRQWSLVKGQASCPRQGCLSVASRPRQDKSTKSRSMLVNGYSPKQGLLVQDKAACQWQVVQGMATCQWTRCQWQVAQGKTTCQSKDYLSKARPLASGRSSKGHLCKSRLILLDGKLLKAMLFVNGCISVASCPRHSY